MPASSFRYERGPQRLDGDIVPCHTSETKDVRLKYRDEAIAKAQITKNEIAFLQIKLQQLEEALAEEESIVRRASEAVDDFERRANQRQKSRNITSFNNTAEDLQSADVTSVGDGSGVEILYKHGEVEDIGEGWVEVYPGMLG